MNAISRKLPRTTFRCQIKHIPFKRIFDVLFSLMVLFLGLPVFSLVILGIKLSSKGSLFYKHERIGRGGKPFQCYKLRTMYTNADEQLAKILNSDSEKHLEWRATRKLKNDPRITPIGKLLRKTSLDEIPQFFNVLIGDLSVVGPRPVLKEEIDNLYGIKAYKILSIRPGLTGIWQVSGRNNTSYKTRLLLDEKYIETQSLLLDIKLILKTVPCMVLAKGAY